jgi:hypothetical protein
MMSRQPAPITALSGRQLRYRAETSDNDSNEYDDKRVNPPNANAGLETRHIFRRVLRIPINILDWTLLNPLEIHPNNR